ncbi:MAG TPA: hypothetical protein VFF73_10120 [Planctomycetota bacterium]|nr:hypothetical protein [Planctomycetota bacterium]
MHTVKCENCGAPLTANPDGSAPGCTYCGVGVARAIDPLALATTLHGVMQDTQKLLDHLAEMLESPVFASFAQVERSGFFTKRVSAVKVTIQNNCYRLEGSGSQLVPHRTKTVKGVALKNEQLPLKQWLEEFSHTLSQLATESKEAEKALQKFVR